MAFLTHEVKKKQIVAIINTLAFILFSLINYTDFIENITSLSVIVCKCNNYLSKPNKLLKYN